MFVTQYFIPIMCFAAVGVAVLIFDAVRSLLAASPQSHGPSFNRLVRQTMWNPVVQQVGSRFRGDLPSRSKRLDVIMLRIDRNCNNGLPRPEFIIRQLSQDQL